MHTKPDLRVFLKWLIARSGSVITAAITLERNANRRIRHLRRFLRRGNVR